jgi:hypothetical protein
MSCLAFYIYASLLSKMSQNRHVDAKQNPYMSYRPKTFHCTSNPTPVQKGQPGITLSLPKHKTKSQNKVSPIQALHPRHHDAPPLQSPPNHRRHKNTLITNFPFPTRHRHPRFNNPQRIRLRMLPMQHTHRPWSVSERNLRPWKSSLLPLQNGAWLGCSSYRAGAVIRKRITGGYVWGLWDWKA